MADSSPTLREFTVDAVERVVFTFIETFLALYTPVVLSVANGGGWHQLLDLSLAQKGVVAGVAAVLVIAKSLYKAFATDVNVPGFLPGWAAKLLGLSKKVQAENTDTGSTGKSA
jgi:hypothetical protein